MTKHKKLSKKSGLTIPKDLRHETGFKPGMAIDMVATDEGILIKKHTPTCHICGTIEKVATYKNFDICAGCADGLSKAVK